jgi:hypothetical protein
MGKKAHRKQNMVKRGKALVQMALKDKQFQKYELKRAREMQKRKHNASMKQARVPYEP